MKIDIYRESEKRGRCVTTYNDMMDPQRTSSVGAHIRLRQQANHVVVQYRGLGELASLGPKSHPPVVHDTRFLHRAHFHLEFFSLRIVPNATRVRRPAHRVPPDYNGRAGKACKNPLLPPNE